MSDFPAGTVVVLTQAEIFGGENQEGDLAEITDDYTGHGEYMVRVLTGPCAGTEGYCVPYHMCQPLPTPPKFGSVEEAEAWMQATYGQRQT